jgi:hypothetical protein
VHGQLLAPFKAAAPRLGLSARLVHAVDWLFRFTQPQDWQEGSRPIVWPSAGTQQEALGLSPSRVKAVNRALIEAGLITMWDSPNGKRYGRRDPKGHIVEAYGFDLAPLSRAIIPTERCPRPAPIELSMRPCASTGDDQAAVIAIVAAAERSLALRVIILPLPSRRFRRRCRPSLPPAPPGRSRRSTCQPAARELQAPRVRRNLPSDR